MQQDTESQGLSIGALVYFTEYYQVQVRPRVTNHGNVTTFSNRGGTASRVVMGRIVAIHGNVFNEFNLIPRQLFEVQTVDGLRRRLEATELQILTLESLKVRVVASSWWCVNRLAYVGIAGTPEIRWGQQPVPRDYNTLGMVFCGLTFGLDDKAMEELHKRDGLLQQSAFLSQHVGAQHAVGLQRGQDAVLLFRQAMSGMWPWEDGYEKYQHEPPSRELVLANARKLLNTVMQSDTDLMPNDDDFERLIEDKLLSDSQ